MSGPQGQPLLTVLFVFFTIDSLFYHQPGSAMILLPKQAHLAARALDNIGKCQHTLVLPCNDSRLNEPDVDQG